MTKNGKPESYWLDIGRAAGYEVDGVDARVFVDKPLGRNQRLAPENLPQLRSMVRVMAPGDQLGIPMIGLLGVPAWGWVAAQLARKDAAVHDLATNRIFNPAVVTDLVDANEVVARQAGGLKVASAAEGRKLSLNKGGPRFKLTGARRQDARLAWGTNDGRTASDIAEQFGIGVATLYRAMTDNGRKDGTPVGRQAAILLHKQGEWMAGKKAKK